MVFNSDRAAHLSRRGKKVDKIWLAVHEVGVWVEEVEGVESERKKRVEERPEDLILTHFLRISTLTDELQFIRVSGTGNSVK